MENEGLSKKKGTKKRASYLNHSAQPSTLAAFPPWGNSRGATCLRLAPRKDTNLCFLDYLKHRNFIVDYKQKISLRKTKGFNLIVKSILLKT
tara:strand:- start:1076 stop:1351 length:276 start_codon:yes stop_codon:yes gene_type:complete